jgi:hypothetical protein
VLLVLREHQLYVKFSKCDFFHKQVHYLGHAIYEEGVVVDLEKIKSIMYWPTPKDVSNIISFMGITRYYRRFIKIFSIIGYPITSLQKKGVQFIWTSRCEEICLDLKYLLTNAPILNISYPNKEFLVCTDAWKEGIRGFLMQDEHVIC